MTQRELLSRLKPNQRRGSKPRCHLLTHGPRKEVADRLTALIAPWGSVSVSDTWMPEGFEEVGEAQLHSATSLVGSSVCQELQTWWLAVSSPTSMTPNIDIASSCTISGKRGLLLVEAKAHEDELVKEESGKLLKPPVTVASRRNHARIGACIRDASLALGGETEAPWALSRDWNYQMSNRFAWAWKLTELGVPVILLYLGFLKAEEMIEKGTNAFDDHADWEKLVKSHSQSLFPSEIWGRQWSVHGQAFVPLIGSIEQNL